MKRIVSVSVLLFAAPLCAQTPFPPHCGTGGGLAMEATATNTSEVPAAARPTSLDPGSQPQALPGLPGAEVELDLAPNETRVLVSDGTGEELLSGSIRVEAVSGRASRQHSGDPDFAEALGPGRPPAELSWPRGLRAWAAAAWVLGGSRLGPPAIWLIWAAALAAFLLGAACRSRLDLTQRRREKAEKFL